MPDHEKSLKPAIHEAEIKHETATHEQHQLQEHREQIQREIEQGKLELHEGQKKLLEAAEKMERAVKELAETSKAIHEHLEKNFPSSEIQRFLAEISQKIETTPTVKALTGDMTGGEVVAIARDISVQNLGDGLSQISKDIVNLKDGLIKEGEKADQKRIEEIKKLLVDKGEQQQALSSLVQFLDNRRKDDRSWQEKTGREKIETVGGFLATSGSGLLGVFVNVVTLAVSGISFYQLKESLKPADKTYVSEIEEWVALPETKFWPQLADQIKTGHVLFHQQANMLSLLQAALKNLMADDFKYGLKTKSEFVQEFVDGLNESGDFPKLYTSFATLQYENRDISRLEKVNLMLLIYGGFIMKKRT